MDRGRILFVDDDVLAQWTLTEALTEAGFTVTGVCWGEEAMRLIGSTDGFDILLIDVLLPGDVTGIDLADFWRLVHPGRAVIYVTSLPRGTVGRLEEDEIYLQKPCSGPDLLAVLDDAFDDARLYTRRTPSVRRSACVH